MHVCRMYNHEQMTTLIGREVHNFYNLKAKKSKKCRFSGFSYLKKQVFDVVPLTLTPLSSRSDGMEREWRRRMLGW